MSFILPVWLTPCYGIRVRVLKLWSWASWLMHLKHQYSATYIRRTASWPGLAHPGTLTGAPIHRYVVYICVWPLDPPPPPHHIPTCLWRSRHQAQLTEVCRSQPQQTHKPGPHRPGRADSVSKPVVKWSLAGELMHLTAPEGSNSRSEVSWNTWLETVTINEPWPFLDHVVRCYLSIISYTGPVPRMLTTSVRLSLRLLIWILVLRAKLTLLNLNTAEDNTWLT